MFDVGFSELLIFAIIALVVLGPEKLPHAARMAGAWMGRIRRTVIDVQAEIEKEVAMQEMRERLKKEIEAAKADELKSHLQEQLEEVQSSLDAARSATHIAPAGEEAFREHILSTQSYRVTDSAAAESASPTTASPEAKTDAQRPE